MIRATACILLALVFTTTNGFAPSPAFGPRRALMTSTPSNNLIYMSSQATEDMSETEKEAVDRANVTATEVAVEQELSETQKLMKQVKESGTAGIVSYALWELAFWTVSVPVCVFGYKEVTG